MCTHTNKNISKRSLEDVALDDCLSSEATPKRQRTDNDKPMPSFVDYIQASMLRRKQERAAKAIAVDSVPSMSNSKPGTASSDSEETLLDESFQPTNWHVVSFQWLTRDRSLSCHNCISNVSFLSFVTTDLRS